MFFMFISEYIWFGCVGVSQRVYINNGGCIDELVDPSSGDSANAVTDDNK